MLVGLSLTNLNYAFAAEILPNAVETEDTFSFDETDNTEQIIITIAITRRTTINAFWLDMSNVTQDVTLRLYKRIDGASYRQFQENAWKTTFDDGVLIPGFIANENVRLTIQCSGAGAGSVDVPYTVL